MDEFADIDLRMAKGIRAFIMEGMGCSLRDDELFDWIRRGLSERAAACFVELSRGTQSSDLLEVATLDGLLHTKRRKDNGIYFTPEWLAEKVASHLDRLDGNIIDISCGTGALLLAALDRGAEGVIGVESDLCLAAGAAAQVLLKYPERSSQIIWGDGLEARNYENVVGVVANPPYLGEKGRKTLFAAIRNRHPDLAEFFRPRMDLAYLFLGRSLRIANGSRVVFLTSEYWLQADSADTLRAAITAEAPAQIVEFLGSENFPDAPGHHSIIFAGGGELTRPVWRSGALPWHRSVPRKASENTRLLGELIHDRQGFVSGADEVEGAPCFLRTSEGPGVGKLRPVLRGSECVANRVFFKVPESKWVLWLDGPITDHEARIEATLGWARPRLERRREAENQTMPWYRLHWPRKRTEMVGPKLVVPRRAARPEFCLDLSGAAISSDCTYLVAPESEGDPVHYLLGVMLALNSSATIEWLHHCGKRKGPLFEFYSTPLKAIPIDLKEYDWERADRLKSFLFGVGEDFLDASTVIEDLE